MTTGAPKIEVIALMGKMVSVPGNWLMVSQNNKVMAPNNTVAKNKIWWLAVLKINLAMCGTANPTKAIGPAKAVTLPANKLVAIIILYCVVFKLIPKLLAYLSPKINALSDFNWKITVKSYN